MKKKTLALAVLLCAAQGLRHPLAHGAAGQKQGAVNVQKDQLGHEKPPV